MSAICPICLQPSTRCPGHPGKTVTLDRLISISKGHLDTCPSFAGLAHESLCNCLPAPRISLDGLVAETRVDNERYAHQQAVAQSDMAVLDAMLDDPRPARARRILGRVGAAADRITSWAWLVAQLAALILICAPTGASLAAAGAPGPGYAITGGGVLACVALVVRWARRWTR